MKIGINREKLLAKYAGLSIDYRLPNLSKKFGKKIYIVRTQENMG
jgi:hypothetical protein